MRLWEGLLARLDALDCGVPDEWPGEEDCLLDAHSSDSESSQGSISGIGMTMVGV
jgi:hypothetical protein